MTNIQSLLELINAHSEALDIAANAGKAVELRMHALLVCVSGIVSTLANDPETAAKLAKNISDAAERMHGVALGYPITDEFLAARNATLNNLLPPELQKLVKLPE